MEDYKNALPDEVEDRRDDDDERPRPLHTQADNEPPLSRAEAEVAGLTGDPEVVYGDDSLEPNEEDQRDAHRRP
ncbi:MAG TPA: hypothetical protein VME66_06795 [Candidatus Acidoferrales bacterium]|nr:hypothetical protein [Candidatus Acidoferrales bacterium]